MTWLIFFILLFLFVMRCVLKFNGDCEELDELAPPKPPRVPRG